MYVLLCKKRWIIFSLAFFFAQEMTHFLMSSFQELGSFNHLFCSAKETVLIWICHTHKVPSYSSSKHLLNNLQAQFRRQGGAHAPPPPKDQNGPPDGIVKYLK